MRRVGLSFGSELLKDAGVGLRSTGYAPFSGATSGYAPFAPDAPVQGYAPFQASNADIGTAGLTNRPTPLDTGNTERTLAYADELFSQFSAPMANSGSQLPQVFYSPSTQRLSVNGFVFPENHAGQALESRNYINAAPAPPPSDAADWREVSEPEYSSYIDSIMNPGAGRLFAEGVQSGMRSIGELYNYGAVFTGIDRQGANERLDLMQYGRERDAPFQRTLDDVHDAGSFGDFAISALGQALPSLVESAAYMGAGAIIGGGVGSAPGAVAGLTNKGAIRAALVRAIAPYRQAGQVAGRGATQQEIIAVARAQAAGNADVLRDLSVLEASINGLANQNRGAAVAGLLHSYATGVADVYGEQLNEGANPDDPNVRGRSLLYGIPYGAAEFAPEYLGYAGLRGMLPRIRAGGPIASTAANVGVYAGAGAASEGFSEGTQEMITTYAGSEVTGDPWWTPETQERVANAAAMGAIPGLFIGGVGGVRPQHDLLNRTQEPPAPAPPGPTPEPPVSPFSGFGVSEQFQAGFDPSTTPGAPLDLDMLNEEQEINYPGILDPRERTGYSVPPVFATDAEPGVAPIMGEQEGFVGTIEGQPQPGLFDGGAHTPLTAPGAQRLRRGDAPTEPAEQLSFSFQEATPVQNPKPLTPEEQALLDAALQDSTRQTPTGRAGGKLRIKGEAQTEMFRSSEMGTAPTPQNKQAALQKPVEQPAEKPVEQPAEKPVEQPAESGRAQAENKLKQRIAELEQLKITSGLSSGQKRSLAKARNELANLEDKKPENAGTTRMGDMRYTASEEVKEEAPKPQAKPKPKPAPKEEKPPNKGEALAAEVRDKHKTSTSQKRALSAFSSNASRPNARYNKDDVAAARELLFGEQPKPAEPQEAAQERVAKAAAKAGEALKRGKNAVQEPSAEKVDAPKQAAASPTVGTRKPKLKLKTSTEEDVIVPQNKEEEFRKLLGFATNKKQSPIARNNTLTALRRFMENNPDVANNVDLNSIEDATVRAASKLEKPEGGEFSRQPWQTQVTKEKATPAEEARVKDYNKGLPGTVSKTLHVVDDYADLKARHPELARSASEAYAAGLEAVGVAYEIHTSAKEKAKDENDVAFVAVRADASKAEVRQRLGFKKNVARDIMHYIPQEMLAESEDVYNRQVHIGYRQESAGVSYYVIPEHNAYRLDFYRRDGFERFSEGSYPAAEGFRSGMTGKDPRSRNAPPFRPARGFSFGDNIILFRKNINAGDMADVYIEELAHHGLRAIFPEKFDVGTEAASGLRSMRQDLKNRGVKNVDKLSPLDATLRWAYEFSLTLRSKVDPLTLRGMPLNEAIEEGLVGLLVERTRQQFKDTGSLEPGIFGAVTRVISAAVRFVRQWIRGPEALKQYNDMKGDLLVDEVIAALQGYLHSGKAFAVFPVEFFSSYPNSLSTTEVLQPANVEPKGKGVARFSRTFTEEDKTDAHKKILRDTAILGGKAPSPTEGNVFTDVSRAQWKTAVDRIADGGKSLMAQFADTISSTDEGARQSLGLTKMLNILREAAGMTHTYQQTWGTYAPLIREAGEFNSKKGLTETQRKRVNKILSAWTLHKLPRTTEEETKKILGTDTLYTLTPEGPVINESVLGRLKAEMKRDLLSKINAGFDVGAVDAPFMRFQDKDLKADDLEYIAVEQVLDMMAQAQADQVIGTLKRQSYSRMAGLEDIAAALRVGGVKALDKRQMNWVVKTADILNDIRKSSNYTEARDVLVEILKSLHMDLKVADWTGANTTFETDAAGKFKYSGDRVVNKFKNDPRLATIINGDADTASMQEMNRLKITKEIQYDILAAMENMSVQNELVDSVHENAANSIVGAYIPIRRRGGWEVRLQAFKGNTPYKLNPEVRAKFPWWLVESETEAKQLAEEAAKHFSGTYDVYDEDGKIDKVTFKLQYGRARTVTRLMNRIDHVEFLRVAESLGIKFTGEAREMVVKKLSAFTQREFAGLKREGTPGFDENTIQGTVEFLDKLAGRISNGILRAQATQVWEKEENWSGSQELLDTFIARFNAAVATGNEALIQREEQALLKYAEMHRHMVKIGVGEEAFFTIPVREKGQIKDRKIKIVGDGERFRQRAKEIFDYLNSSDDVSFTAEMDLEALGWPRLLAVITQLGGPPAAAIINLTSFHNALWELAGMNKKSGFGGGFGEVRAARALADWMVKIADTKLSDPFYLKKMVMQRSWAQHGLSEREAKFLAKETMSGVTRPQQAISLSGGAQTRLLNVAAQRAMDKWMYFFAETEAYLRRVIAMAAYELEYERMAASGVTSQDLSNENSAAYNELRELVEGHVYSSQGDYNPYNTSKLLRGGVAGYLFQYKKFPIAIVQLMKNLPRTQQMQMLATLFLMAGIKGLPFADDLFDVANTLAQKFGFQMADVELEMGRMVDTFIPGASPVFMRGILDYIFQTTVSNRLSMGDIIPMTELMLASSDPGQVVTRGLGPAVSANVGLLDLAGTSVTAMAGAAGLIAPTASGQDVAARAPAAFRPFAALFSWGPTGEITDRRGRFVTEADLWTVSMGALGFYDLEQSEMYEFVGHMRNEDMYVRAVKRSFVEEYVAARRRGDRGQMQRLRESVERWNESARDADREQFIIRDFMGATLAAGRYRDDTPLERYIRVSNPLRRESLRGEAERAGVEVD